MFQHIFCAEPRLEEFLRLAGGAAKARQHQKSRRKRSGCPLGSSKSVTRHIRQHVRPCKHRICCKMCGTRWKSKGTLVRENQSTSQVNPRSFHNKVSQASDRLSNFTSIKSRHLFQRVCAVLHPALSVQGPTLPAHKAEFLTGRGGRLVGAGTSILQPR